MTLSPGQFHEVYDTEHATARVSRSGYVHNVSVSQSHRRQGHGTALMQKITNDADRLQQPLTLHAREELHPWYESLGFEHADDDFDDRSGLSMPRLERRPRAQAS